MAVERSLARVGFGDKFGSYGELLQLAWRRFPQLPAYLPSPVYLAANRRRTLNTGVSADMQNLYEPEPGPSEIASLLWRQKWKMLLVGLVVVVGTLAYASLASRKFRSHAKLFVRIGRESVSLDPTATTGQTISVGDSREGEIAAIQEMLGSRMLLEQVVDEFTPEVILENKKTPSKVPVKEIIKKALASLDQYNLNPLRVYSVRDKAIATLQKNLSLQSAKQTSVISLSYQCKNPKLAQQVLDWLIAKGKDEHLRVNRTAGSHEFFDEQADLLKADLTAREEELRLLKNDTGLASFEQQRQIHLARIGSLEDELVRSQSDLRAAEAEVASRQAMFDKLPELIVAEETSGQPQSPEFMMRDRLYELEIQERDMMSKFTDDNPRLKQIRVQLAEARKIQQESGQTTQVRKATNKTREASDLTLHERRAEMESLKARVSSLVGQIAIAKREVNTLNDNEIKVANIQREIDLANLNYRKYAENLEQARINHELAAAKISSINIMQPPSYSQTPASPNLPIVFGLGGIFAFCSSFGIALLADRRRQPSRIAAPAIVAQPLARQTVVVAEPREASLDVADELADELDDEFQPAAVGGNGLHLVERPGRGNGVPSNPR
jgi:uncharacterized protein involved in exopolysaccharide biosynthesis